MRNVGGVARLFLVVPLFAVVVLLWGCSGVHLRPESYDWVAGERTAPAAVSAAKAALAEAEAAGAARIDSARYQVAKAKEYLMLAERELFERDLAAAETAAEIAKQAAGEAKAIAQRTK